MGIGWVIPTLQYSGYVTLGLLLALPVFNTFKHVLSMKSVGGGTRVEPFVASLLAYCCSFLLASFDNKWEFNKMKGDESCWINGISTFVYLLYLYLFLRYADDHHSVRRATLWVWAPAAVAYLGVTTTVGLLAETTDGVSWMCMIAGVASSCTPLFLTWFVMEKYVENLPDWLSSAVGVLHYTVWIFREPGFYDRVQNIVGALSSIAFLAMLYMWRNRKAPIVGNQDVVIQVDENNEANNLRLPEARRRRVLTVSQLHRHLRSGHFPGVQFQFE